MDENRESKLENLISSVLDTLSFHGVEISGLGFEEEVPRFDVILHKNRMINPTDKTLDLTYWSLWSLVHGKYDNNKAKSRIILRYKEEGGEDSED